MQHGDTGTLRFADLRAANENAQERSRALETTMVVWTRERESSDHIYRVSLAESISPAFLAEVGGVILSRYQNGEMIYWNDLSDPPETKSPPTPHPDAFYAGSRRGGFGYRDH